MHAILARLDTTPAPIIQLRELLPFSEPAWRALLRAGVLVEAEAPSAIETTPGRWLRVQRRADRFVGFDEREEYPSPVPLTRDDVTAYRISLPALLAQVRTMNAIDGRAVGTAAGKLHAIGRKQLPGGSVVHVWFALNLGQGDAITAALAPLAQESAHAAHVVVFPLWPDLPPTIVAALVRSRVWIADLDPDRLTIRWPQELHAETAPDLPAYAFLAEGATWRVHFLGESFTVRAVKGVLLLARLLDDPSQTWTPLELERGFRIADRDSPAAPDEDGLVVADEIGATLEAADPKQLAVYRQELVRLQRQLAQAEAEGREIEIAEATQELADWQARIDESVGLGGRARLTGAKERARKNISKLINEALDRISRENTRVGKHLRQRVRLGSSLTYTPDAGEVWRVRFPGKK